jgi:glyoxylase-like metal-dependent hydrolase (beta-lactamase superfamily II)
MSRSVDEGSQLAWQVYVAREIPVVTKDIPPGQTERWWPPTSATLISGNRNAVLVDALFTTEQAEHLSDWVARTGKALRAIYITHGHGDHFLGAGILLERFPSAKVVATPRIAKRIRQQGSLEQIRSFWEPRFPGRMSDHTIAADALSSGTFYLEGHEFIAVDAGHTDTTDSTFLHVPSIGLVVAGDVAYNDVHLHLEESTPETRREWIIALDKIEALRPRAVVAGHRRLDADDDPGIVAETRKYIRDFDRVAKTTSSPLELYSQMLDIYPHRINSGALWSSALAAKH